MSTTPFLESPTPLLDNAVDQVGEEGLDDIDLKIEKAKENGEQLSFQEAFLTSLNYNMGLALLCFPYQIYLIGWSAYPILLFTFIVSWITALWIGKIMASSNLIFSYADIAVHAVAHFLDFLSLKGLISSEHDKEHSKSLSFASNFTRLFQIIELYFYLVWGQVFMKNAFEMIFDESINVAWIWLMVVFLHLPLALLPSVRSPRFLSKISVVSMIVYICILTIMIGSSIYKLSDSNSKPYLDFPIFPPTFKLFESGYGSILCICAGHAAYPSIYHNLEHKNDYPRVVNYTYVSMFIALVILGAICSIAQGTSLVELPTGFLETGTLLSNISQVLLILKCVLSYPIISFPIMIELTSRFVQANSNLPRYENVIEPNENELDHFDENDDPESGLAGISFPNLQNASNNNINNIQNNSAIDLDNGLLNDSNSGDDSEPPFDIDEAPQLHQEELKEQIEEELVFALSYSPFRVPRLQRIQTAIVQATPMEKEPIKKNRSCFNLIYNVDFIQGIISLMLLLATFLTAILVPGLEWIMNLVGAVFVVSLAIIFPSLYYAMIWHDSFGIVIFFVGIASMVIAFGGLF